MAEKKERQKAEKEELFGVQELESDELADVAGGAPDQQGCESCVGCGGACQTYLG